MAKEQPSNVDLWLGRETNRKRKALESASRHFDASDGLTVNTIEAVYGQESSFGAMLRKRGSASAAGHFQLEPATARRYGLSVSKKNDQRFDIDYASSAAARYLKDLDSMFSQKTRLSEGLDTFLSKAPRSGRNLFLGLSTPAKAELPALNALPRRSGKTRNYGVT